MQTRNLLNGPANLTNTAVFAQALKKLADAPNRAVAKEGCTHLLDIAMHTGAIYATHGQVARGTQSSPRAYMIYGNAFMYIRNLCIICKIMHNNSCFH